MTDHTQAPSKELSAEELVAAMRREALCRGAELDFDDDGPEAVAKEHILWKAADQIESLLCEIGAHHSALLKIENEVRGISTAERKAYLLTVIGRVREWTREAIHG